MTAFLITFKPAAENPKRGWPVAELQKLVRRLSNGEPAEELWRFKNRRDAQKGDRVFLLLQGKGGPAIIGYGKINGRRQRVSGTPQIPISFERLVDPSAQVLATRKELFAVQGGERFWRIPSSGVRLDDNIAAELETLVVDRAAKPLAHESASNPDWSRDELIVALDVYLKYRPNPPGKGSKEISDLSRVVNQLGAKLFRSDSRSATFRNENGVYMKLMNFSRFDPEYTVGGRRGLVRGAKLEEEVWKEFSGDPDHCHDVAQAIIASLERPEIEFGADDEGDDLQEAPEGRLLTRIHFYRERRRDLVESKRKKAMARNGRLACEVCEFDFSIAYGGRGLGFIECHHTKPLATLGTEIKTHIDDLALVCANCHRMIHRRHPWLTLAELRGLISGGKH
jgi:5-methylcytosine-specific restriction protein A